MSAATARTLSFSGLFSFCSDLVQLDSECIKDYDKTSSSKILPHPPKLMDTDNFSFLPLFCEVDIFFFFFAALHRTTVR